VVATVLTLLAGLGSYCTPEFVIGHFKVHHLGAWGTAGRDIIAALQPWFEMVDLGLKTTSEESEPTRSDCHAWSSHPLYYFFASVLGIRPSSFGFETVRIAPQLGSLEWARGSLVHPRGLVEVDFKVTGPEIQATIRLPDGVNGELVYAGQTFVLQPGLQSLNMLLRK